MPDVHAKLGASNAHRWLTCTAAPALEATLPDEGEDSPYAEEGTFAHAWAEAELKARLGLTTTTVMKRRHTSLKKTPEGQRWYSLDLKRYAENYVDLVMDEVAEYETLHASFVEQRVPFDTWVPGGFGTADAVLIGDDVLHVLDLKYGQGVPVDATENPQGMLYGLGALFLFGEVFDIKRVRITIIQPRLHSVSTYEVDVRTLLAWADDVVRPAALAADTGEGAEFAPGEKACRWCAAKSICRARAEQSVAEDFGAKAPTLTEAEIADLLARIPAIKAWASDVEKYALDAAKRGTRFPGFKLVEGRATRRIVDTGKAEALLADVGLDRDDFMKPAELQTLGVLDSLMKGRGGMTLDTLLGSALAKPAGAPTLVPASDKRPELNSAASAAADFADELLA